MYLLPGNPFSQAVEAYRDSGEKRDVQTVPTRTTCPPPLQYPLVGRVSLSYRLVNHYLPTPLGWCGPSPVEYM